MTDYKRGDVVLGNNVGHLPYRAYFYLDSSLFFLYAYDVFYDCVQIAETKC